jgi:hypothetical protein
LARLALVGGLAVTKFTSEMKRIGCGLSSLCKPFGYLGQPKGIEINKYMLIDDRVDEVHSVIVHRFKMGDVEDPDLYAAQPLWAWQQSEMGAWVMEHSVETPMWHRQANPNQYHTDYAVQAWLRGADYTYWVLKWADTVLTNK